MLVTDDGAGPARGSAGAPKATVVISTYRAPDRLERVLLGYAEQSVRGFEIVVADDGSGEETVDCLDRFRDRPAFELRHVWQPDDGFRKCRILNRAIAAARSDYLIFTDGDCIPRRDFVEAHLRLRRPGAFLSGGYVKLSQRLSRAVGPAEIASGRAIAAPWLLRRGLAPRRKAIRLALSGRAAALFDRLTPTRPSFNGHNASAWRSDLVRVNGFDERMAYGGEDRELGERLVNAGIRGLQVRHRAVCVHLAHERDYRDEDAIARNRSIRAGVRRKRATWCRPGLDVHM